MRALITGGAGFIAHHVIEHLLDETDWQITVLDRLDYSGNLNRLDEILSHRSDRSRVKVVFHDLRAELNPMVSHLVGQPEIIQLSHAVDRELLFKNYLYVSGTTQTQLEYFEWFAKTSLAEVYAELGKPAHKVSVLDVGCNDGSQLKYFPKVSVHIES